MTPPPPEESEAAAGGEEEQGAARQPWAKPSLRVLVAGWFADSTADGIFRITAYEFSPHYPPTAVVTNYINPPS